jgi:hypothetical protein
MSSTTSTTPSSSPSDHPAPNNDGRTSIVGIVLAIAGLFVVAAIIYTTWRLKRRRSGNPADDPFNSPNQGTILDRAHPAARITPFGSPGGETPRFSACFFTHLPEFRVNNNSQNIPLELTCALRYDGLMVHGISKIHEHPSRPRALWI